MVSAKRASLDRIEAQAVPLRARHKARGVAGANEVESVLGTAMVYERGGRVPGVVGDECIEVAAVPVGGGPLELVGHDPEQLLPRRGGGRSGFRRGRSRMAGRGEDDHRRSEEAHRGAGWETPEAP